MAWNGAITGEANKSRLVVYKQMQQELIASEKQNSISNKLQEKRYNICHLRGDFVYRKVAAKNIFL